MPERVTRCRGDERQKPEPAAAGKVVPTAYVRKARASTQDADLEDLPSPTARGNFKRLALMNRSLKQAAPPTP